MNFLEFHPVAFISNLNEITNPFIYFYVILLFISLFLFQELENQVDQYKCKNIYLFFNFLIFYKKY
jgi:hypothetical protein